MTQVSFRAEIDEYTNRVLGVIKEKYGLKTKSEALNMFAKMHGEAFVEQEIRDELVEEIKEIEFRHRKKHPNRKMTLKELDKLCGINV